MKEKENNIPKKPNISISGPIAIGEIAKPCLIPGNKRTKRNTIEIRARDVLSGNDLIAGSSVMYFPRLTIISGSLMR
ncbi:MAG: hypothetical protein ACFFAE_20590 [Candidatus Hodarchaeota archaeon]